MISTTATLTDPPAPDAPTPVPERRRTPPRWRRDALALLLLLSGATLAWFGEGLALAGVACVLGAAWCRHAAVPGRAPEAATSALDRHNRIGAEVMVSQVVPVWSRQIEVTRDSCGEGLGSLLTSFAEVSSQLQELADKVRRFSPTADAGSTEQALSGAEPALAKLCEASSRAFAERDAAVAELGRCVVRLGELKHLAKQSRELARHTRLVAFNASIEANRSHRGQDGGSNAVATEVRMLAARFAETGEQIERIVNALATAVESRHHRAQASDTSPEELQLEIGLRAREALGAMLGGLGSSLQGFSQIEQAGAALGAQIDQTFVHFQFGDRVSQMLAIVANDMNNFASWVAENPRATQSDAAEWLTRLEASYTMEEQRSHHHGNVHVERSSGVEFF